MCAARKKFGSEALAELGAQALAEHFTSGQAPWHNSEGWRACRELRQVLAKLPELRKLVRRIGRRAAVKGPRRWLPAEDEVLVAPMGVARSSSAPTQTSGLTRSGSVELMLPMEAHLLVHGRRHRSVRALHHSRRLEQSLLSYLRASWLEVPTHERLSEEMRPAGENGPLILCLDTSGSMAPLAFECLRQAQQQSRRCYLFAFSAGAQLKEMELDLSSNLKGLLDFLSFAFHGGTSLNEVLSASVERLHLAQWQNADLLVVTDGEVPKPSEKVLVELDEAKSSGARVYGVVVGSKTGTVMMDLCTETKDVALDSHGWALRRVPAQAMPVPRRSQLSSASTFAGSTWSARTSRGDGLPMKASRLETRQEREDRETRWAEREKARLSEHEKAVESKMGKRWQWEAEAQAAKIELVYQESRLGEAKLQLELKKHFQSRFLSPHKSREAEEDLVAAQWGEDHFRLGTDKPHLALGLFQVRTAGRTAGAFPLPRWQGPVVSDARDHTSTDRQNLGYAMLLHSDRVAAAFGLREEICRRGLEGSEEDVTERSRQLLERCLRRSADAGHAEENMKSGGNFDFEDLPFSPELRHLLESVEAERARLQHKEAQVGHLALALTAPQFRFIWEPLLEELGWGSSPCQGLQSSFAKLADGLVERSVEAKLLLLAALAGEHLFLLGSPGTAKSLLARRLSKVCEGSYFERLLTRFTDELRRKTKGYLPECDVAFIDEIFKANSSILNSLLVILNERRFDNGEQSLKVPLWCAVAASNELPDSDELDALYDRFLLRRHAEPRFEVSDRRLARSVRLLRIAAAAAGGRTVVEADLLLLRHMFWDRDPEQGQLVTEWLLRRLGESGDGKKAWSFLLEGLQTRLRHGARGPGLEAARRDLRNLQQDGRDAASRAMLRLAHISRNAPNGPAEEGRVDRFFWLSGNERRQAAELGEKCAEEAERLQDLLKEVSPLNPPPSTAWLANRASLMEGIKLHKELKRALQEERHSLEATFTRLEDLGENPKPFDLDCRQEVVECLPDEVDPAPEQSADTCLVHQQGYGGTATSALIHASCPCFCRGFLVAWSGNNGNRPGKSRKEMPHLPRVTVQMPVELSASVRGSECSALSSPLEPDSQLMTFDETSANQNGLNGASGGYDSAGTPQASPGLQGKNVFEEIQQFAKSAASASHSKSEGLLDQGSSSKWKEFNSSLLNYVAGALVLLNSLKLGLEKGHGLLDWMLLA
eukprot:g14789.t1